MASVPKMIVQVPLFTMFDDGEVVAVGEIAVELDVKVAPLETIRQAVAATQTGPKYGIYFMLENGLRRSEELPETYDSFSDAEAALDLAKKEYRGYEDYFVRELF